MDLIVMRCWKKIVFVLGCAAIAGFLAPSAQSQTSPWVTGYYAGWNQGGYNNGVLPAEGIDYSALTHIIHFSLVPNADASLDTNSNSLHQINSTALLPRAHAAGVKVLIAVGGWGSAPAFRGATSAANLSLFVANLVSFMRVRGYDGIDLDWEVLEPGDSLQFTLFVRLLRQQLDALSPRGLLTAAVGWNPRIIASLAGQFDQINIMSYDISGPWPGWVTWHNSALYDGGFVFPNGGAPPLSADRFISDFAAAGVPRSKIGIGIDFYGYVWSGGQGTSTGGAVKPRQTWSSPPAVRGNVPYRDIMTVYYKPEYYCWDSIAAASYLGVDLPGSDSDKFISYDDGNMIRAKVQYARSTGLGGIFIWDLGGGYLPAGVPERDRLLHAAKKAVHGVANPPEIPEAGSPPNNLVGLTTNPVLRWEPSLEAIGYHLQVSRSPDFSTLDIARHGGTANSASLPGLQIQTTYYWRVRAVDIPDTSAWSATSVFTTAADTLLPPSWMYMSRTGKSATIVIPRDADVNLDTIAMQPGNAIGVFFRQDGKDLCAGLSLWRRGVDCTITCWGDDSSTQAKEGFSRGDTIYYRIWDRSSRMDRPVPVVYRSGTKTFLNGGRYILRSIGKLRLTGEVPRQFELAQNYPNPFNPSTVIQYSIPENARVRLELYGLRGERVAVLVDRTSPPGTYRVTFRTEDLASGVYYYRLSADGVKERRKVFEETKKMLVVR
jgi:chitinase